MQSLVRASPLLVFKISELEGLHRRRTKGEGHGVRAQCRALRKHIGGGGPVHHFTWRTPTWCTCAPLALRKHIYGAAGRRRG